MRPRLPSHPLVRHLHLLLAAIVLAARLLAPLQAAAMQADPTPLWPGTICHTPSPDDPAPQPAHHHHDCLLCPACHLVAQAVLPSTPAAPLPPPSVHPIGQAVHLPPATAPPTPPRRTAQPTGPPAASV